MEVRRLNLGTVQVTRDPWPVHGFALLHDSLGVVLVDTGCGGPDSLLREYRVVNRSIASALAEHGLTPADVRIAINTHLHFDHCGQNAAFAHARVLVQRDELARARRENDDVWQWLEHVGTRFELLDGDTALADDLSVIATHGHTSGHQSVVATTDLGTEVFVGDAAFKRTIWDHPDTESLPDGQAQDLDAWRGSLARLRSIGPQRVHFCHDV